MPKGTIPTPPSYQFAALTDADILRFWDKVRRGLPNECWAWTAATNPQGYGQLTVFVPDGESGQRIATRMLAHRISFYLANGYFDPTLCICHRCDNPPCVNPAHLFSGTYAENAADREQKGRNGHKYSSEMHEALAHAYLDGLSLRDVARRFGVSADTVMNALKRNGVPRRNAVAARWSRP